MILYDNQKFIKINVFDCHRIDFVNEFGGGYFKTLPISPKEHRMTSELPSKVEIRRDSQFTHFDITTDWGKKEAVSIGNEHTDYIDTAIAGAKEQGLL